MTDILFLKLWFAVQCLCFVPALHPIATGGLTYYTPERMEEVLYNRFVVYEDIHPRWGHVPLCKVALNENRVGDYVVLFHDRGWVLCLVVDVAQYRHAKQREREGNVAEVDKATYDWIKGYSGRAWVTVAELPDEVNSN